MKERPNLIAALKALGNMIEDPMFRTKIGQTFSFDEIEAAMTYRSDRGDKAILVTA